VDGCRLLDWTNIAENVISGLVTTAIVGVAVFIHGRTTALHRKKRKKRPRKRR
jgi:hypothetical protein